MTHMTAALLLVLAFVTAVALALAYLSILASRKIELLERMLDLAHSRLHLAQEEVKRTEKAYRNLREEHQIAINGYQEQVRVLEHELQEARNSYLQLVKMGGSRDRLVS